MKNLGLFICSLVVFSACGGSSSNEVVTEGSVKQIEADTISKDTLQIAKKARLPPSQTMRMKG